MRLFVLASFFLLTFSSLAQYKPILGNYTEWTVAYCDSADCYIDYYLSYGDTVVGGHQYKFLDLYHFNRNFLIRDDIASERVYMIVLADAPNLRTYLLYDFGVDTNDVVTCYNPYSPQPQGPNEYRVDSIKQLNYLGVIRKTIYLTNLDTMAVFPIKNTVWVEGIGSKSLIHTPGALGDTYGVGFLRCMLKDGTPVYESDSLQEIKCNSTFNTIEERYINHQLVEVKGSKLTVGDNPVQISVFTLEGKQVADFSASKNEVYTISQLQVGVFLVVITDDNSNRQIVKMLR